jgi:hypothetical protein
MLRYWSVLVVYEMLREPQNVNERLLYVPRNMMLLDVSWSLDKTMKSDP